MLSVVLPSWWLAAAIAFAALCFACFVVILVRRRRSGQEPAVEELLAIDVASLSADEPPTSGPKLELYNLPVRLALFVLAPAGRDGFLPPPDELPAIVEEMLPGFYDVLSAHRPEYCPWPPQLSWHGFTRQFFKAAALPGNRGKGTPWSSVAGRFEADGTHYLAGMIMRAGKANSLGEYVVEHETKWLDLLRVRLPDSAAER